jgi:hypothetical protein
MPTFTASPSTPRKHKHDITSLSLSHIRSLTVYYLQVPTPDSYGCPSPLPTHSLLRRITTKTLFLLCAEWTLLLMLSKPRVISKLKFDAQVTVELNIWTFDAAPQHFSPSR